MIESFKKSFVLKNTYQTNKIIYLIKSIPLIKKLLPSNLYASRHLKRFANVISFLYELFSTFIGKAIYVSLMLFLPVNKIDGNRADSFIHIFIFLTLIGACLNTQMFNPTKDKYYAIILLRMDAKKYTISNYFYFLIKMIIGFMPFTIIFGRLLGTGYLSVILMPVFVVCIKSIVSAFSLSDYNKKHKAKNENKIEKLTYFFVGGLLICAYLPVYLGFAIPEVVFYFICAVALIASVFSFKYIIGFDNYKLVYKDIFSDPSSMMLNGKNDMEVQQNVFLNKLDFSAEITSNKSGYEFFNDLFIKRHRRLLMKTSKRSALISVGVFVVALVTSIFSPKLKLEINELMLTYLPYFLFVMYFINSGKNMTRAMFMNCDHSMLAYRFYRQPKVILNVFTTRLKSIVSISLIPASVIAVGLPLLLFFTGGTDNWLNYVALFVSIIAMAVFFSVHNMVLYYLFQPYNINIESKNPVYSIVNGVTYMVCYMAIGKKMETITFGLIISAFSLIYIVVALILVYRFAPKTFKLRQ